MMDMVIMVNSVVLNSNMHNFCLESIIKGCGHQIVKTQFCSNQENTKISGFVDFWIETCE